VKEQEKEEEILKQEEESSLKSSSCSSAGEITFGQIKEEEKLKNKNNVENSCDIKEKVKKYFFLIFFLKIKLILQNLIDEEFNSKNKENTNNSDLNKLNNKFATPEFVATGNLEKEKSLYFPLIFWFLIKEKYKKILIVCE